MKIKWVTPGLTQVLAIQQTLKIERIVTMIAYNRISCCWRNNSNKTASPSVEVWELQSYPEASHMCPMHNPLLWAATKCNITCPSEGVFSTMPPSLLLPGCRANAVLSSLIWHAKISPTLHFIWYTISSKYLGNVTLYFLLTKDFFVKLASDSQYSSSPSWHKFQARTRESAEPMPLSIPPFPGWLLALTGWLAVG